MRLASARRTLQRPRGVSWAVASARPSAGRHKRRAREAGGSAVSEIRPPPAQLRIGADLRHAVDGAMARATDQRWAERLWNRDVSLWTEDERVQKLIAN